MDARIRDRFDAVLEEVLAEMPAEIHALIDRVPLHVEDYPSDEVLATTGSKRDELCGLFTGIPLGDKSIEHSGVLPDVVTIYRLGILSQAAGTSGRYSRRRLKEEIRITILHELAHFHGIDEEELGRLGYG